MPNTLLRQRRRIAAALLFAQIAVYLVWPDPAGAATVALGTVVASIAVIQTAGSQRRWVECCGAGAVVASLLPVGLLLPGLVVMPVVLHVVLYGRVLDRTRLRFVMISTQKLIAPGSITSTWTAMVPGEGSAEEHWSGQLIDYGRDADDEDTVYMRFRDRDEIYEERIVTFLENSYPARARYLEEIGAEGQGQEKIVTLDLAALDDGRTEIRSETVMEDLPVRLALSHWFDDTTGDELDGFAEPLKSRRRWRLHRSDAPKIAQATADAA